MFLKDAWYVAAWSRDIGAKPFARTLLGEPVVIFRRSDGSLAALEDRCAHRHVPLHIGKIVGDNLQCGYHGLVYNGEGTCVRIPTQDSIPPQACVRAFAVVERYGWVWVWMGERAAADAALIPDFHWLDDPAFAATGATNHVRCDYRLVNDNLLDLSHVGFVHDTTIGNAAMGEKGRISVDRGDGFVRVTRWVIDCPPPVAYLKTGRIHGNIDRWQIIHFEAPCYVRICVGGAPTGTGAPEGRREGGITMWVLNAMTPESADATWYHWAIVRDYDLDKPAISDVLFEQVSRAFEEDKLVLELQQRSLDRNPQAQEINLTADSGAIQARRMLAATLSRGGAGRRPLTAVAESLAPGAASNKARGAQGAGQDRPSAAAE